VLVDLKSFAAKFAREMDDVGLVWNYEATGMAVANIALPQPEEFPIWYLRVET